MSGRDSPLDDPAAVQFRLATIWQTKGYLERARAGYEAAIRLRPGYLPAHLELGRLLTQRGSVEDAATVYRRAIALHPGEACFPQRLAELLARQEGPRAARGGAGSGTTNRWPSDAPHIVIYTDCPGIAGAERCTHAVALHLVQSGYRVTYVQGRAAHALIDERERRGIRHLWIEEDDLYNLAQPARALVDDREPERILDSLRPALVIFADGAPISTLAAKRAARRLGIPYLAIVHCVAAEWADRYAPYVRQLPQIYQAALAVVTVSHAGLALLRERFGLPDHRGQVIYNGRPAAFFATPEPETRDRVRGDLDLPPAATVVCTVASMELRKGYSYQLRAIRGLRERPAWSSLHFVWVGAGTLEAQIRATVERIGVSERVRFPGERHDVRDILAAADIFVLPSRYEGMPLSVMEAMAGGLPVAATGVGGMAEELGGTGALLPDPATDPEGTVISLVETIDAWARDPRLRRAIGAAGRRRARALFTERRMLEEYLRLIARTLRPEPDSGGTERVVPPVG